MGTCDAILASRYNTSNSHKQAMPAEGRRLQTLMGCSGRAIEQGPTQALSRMQVGKENDPFPVIFDQLSCPQPSVREQIPVLKVADVQASETITTAAIRLS